jgi:hypothetical protein
MNLERGLVFNARFPTPLVLAARKDPSPLKTGRAAETGRGPFRD